MRRPGLFTVLLVAAGVVGSGHPASRAQAQQPPAPRFRTGVDLVEVSLLVRDGHGKLVTDLERDEITVLENGVAQPVVAFEQVALPVVPAAQAPPVPRVVQDVASNESIAPARVFALVLDSHHVAATRARNVKVLARQFIENQVGPNDYVGVFSPGALPAATQDFTTDKARLLAAVDSFTGMKMASAVIEVDREAQAVERGSIAVHDGRDPSDSERTDRALALTGTLEALANHLERIPGRRKSLLLFSEGVDYDQADLFGKVQRNASDVMRGMGRAIGALMRTNVALYGIDPRGANLAEMDLLETPMTSQAGMRNSVAGRSVTTEQNDSIGTLRSLSDSTGGFAAVNTNDFAGAFQRILDESSAYYVIGYSPERPAKPGEFRSIAVKVSRPDVSISARNGYTGKAAFVARRAADVPMSEPASSGFPAVSTRGRGRAPEPLVMSSAPAAVRGLSETLQALLASPLPQPGLPIRVQAIPMRGDGKKTEVRLVVEVLGRALQFEDRGGRSSERIELALLTVNESGRASNGTSIAIDLRLTPEDLVRVKGTGVRWLSELELPPGRHQLRVAGRAELTGVSGMLTQDIVVPETRRAGFGLSGVTITSVPSVLMITKGKVWLEQALPTPPTAARTFVGGDQMVAAVEVYRPERGGSEGVLAMTVERADGSPSGVSDRRALPANGARTEEIGFPVSTAKLPAGRYVLRVALDAPGSERIERAVPFDVVGR